MDDVEKMVSEKLQQEWDAFKLELLKRIRFLVDRHGKPLAIQFDADVWNEMFRLWTIQDMFETLEEIRAAKRGPVEPIEPIESRFKRFMSEAPVPVFKSGYAPTIDIRFDKTDDWVGNEFYTVTSPDVPGFSFEVYNVLQLRRRCAEVIEKLLSGPKEPPILLQHARRVGRVRICFEVEVGKG
jgi:hypothetical protein